MWRGLERFKEDRCKIFHNRQLTISHYRPRHLRCVARCKKNYMNYVQFTCSSIRATCCTELQKGDQLPKWWKVTMNHSLSTPLISQLMDGRSVNRGWSQNLPLFRPWREVTVPGPLYWAKEKRHALTVCVEKRCQCGGANETRNPGVV